MKLSLLMSKIVFIKESHLQPKKKKKDINIQISLAVQNIKDLLKTECGICGIMFCFIAELK